jgi:hypothetical protein
MIAIPMSSALSLAVPFVLSLAAATTPAPETVTPHQIRALYFDLLSRSPFEKELVAAEPLSFEALVDELMAAPERQTAWYEEQLDFFLLHDSFRPPDGTGLGTLPADLAAGKLTWRDALELIVSSSFFNARNPGPDTFVTVVLEQILGMNVQENPRVLEAGKRLYDGKSGELLGSKGQNQSDVVRIVVRHPGAAKHFVAREFERIFHRAPPPEKLAAWAKDLDAGKLSHHDLLRAWLCSADYAAALKEARPKSDTAFVRGLYVDVLRRLPDDREEKRLKAAFRSIADKAPLRAVVARVLLTSPDAKLGRPAPEDAPALVAAQFRRFLGREPKPEESSAFAAALVDPAGSPLSTARALVTHWEYLYY